MTTPIRIILADDNSLVRQGIRKMLASIDDIHVVGEAEDGQEAVTLAQRLKPDVVVMDISMPQVDGLEATERIQALNTSTQVLILSMHTGPAFVRRAVRKGARGYVLKRTATQDLVPALYTVAEGERYFSPKVGGPPANDGGAGPADR